MRIGGAPVGDGPDGVDAVAYTHLDVYKRQVLGLAVVRDLTELHGGTVTVESRVKKGSTFTVRIPYVPVIEEEDEEA